MLKAYSHWKAEEQEHRDESRLLFDLLTHIFLIVSQICYLTYLPKLLSSALLSDENVY